MTSFSRDDLLNALQWTIAMGADECIDERSRQWFDEDSRSSDVSVFLPSNPQIDLQTSATSPKERAREPSPVRFEKQQASPYKNKFDLVPVPSAVVSVETVVHSARECVASLKTLEELQRVLMAFEGCSLKKTAKNLCFYRGSPKAHLMIIGEAPGRDEDLEGRPFVGRAGQLLDRMLRAIGLEEKDVHITNVVYWRPPGNRTPTSQEAEMCRPFLEKQISLVAPHILLLLGTSAAKHILQKEDGIMRLRGRWFETKFDSLEISTLASLHPAYLLRSPAAKKFAWRDLLLLKKKLSKREMP